jgi:hypothetical protein
LRAILRDDSFLFGPDPFGEVIQANYRRYVRVQRGSWESGLRGERKQSRKRRQGGVVGVDWRCASMLGDGVGRDEYIDQKHSKCRKIRRRAVELWRLTRIGFLCGESFRQGDVSPIEDLPSCDLARGRKRVIRHRQWQE